MATITITILSLIWMVVMTTKKKERQQKARQSTKFKKAVLALHKAVPGAFPMLMRRVDDDFEGIFKQKCSERHRLFKGKVVILDRATKDIVLVVKFKPFDSMSEENQKEFNHLTTSLFGLKMRAAPVKGNKVHCNGKMFALNWRAGMERALSLGSSSSQQSEIQDREAGQEEIVSWIAAFYKKMLHELVPKSLNYSDSCDSQESCTGFADTLTYTLDYSSEYHRDNDGTSYTFGIWAPVHRHNGELATANQGFHATGGEFVIPSYNLFVDFAACNGVVEVLWRGNDDFYATIPSEFAPGFTRIGTSVQISTKLNTED